MAVEGDSQRNTTRERIAREQSSLPRLAAVLMTPEKKLERSSSDSLRSVPKASPASDPLAESVKFISRFARTPAEVQALMKCKLFPVIT